MHIKIQIIRSGISIRDFEIIDFFFYSRKKDFFWVFSSMLLNFLFKLCCTIENSVGSNFHIDGLQIRKGFVDNSVMLVFELLS